MDPGERLKEETEETLSYLKNNGLAKADIGIVLGFGLSQASGVLSSARSLNLEDIPNFPLILSSGYGKRLFFTEVYHKRVVLLEGHFNLFEGYTARSVAYPIWILSRLGVKSLVYFSEGFSLGEKGEKGRFILAKDHLSFIDENPVLGILERESGFDLKFAGSVYNLELSKILREVLKERKASWSEGVVAFRRGPLVETRAEAFFLNKVGADLVCYSGYPEVATAAALGMKLAFLAITTAQVTQPVNQEERLKVAEAQVPMVKEVIKKFLRKVEANGV